ncbi:MAG: hypothetical protein PHD29_00090 [bacterium]|nr:hypothetical protein [bacterium]
MLNVRDILPTNLESSGIRAPSTEKRKYNILWVRDLPRVGLIYGKKEKQILIKFTKKNESLRIQYPGKEAERASSRPWDFRPELITLDKKRMDNLSFGNIAGKMYQELKECDESKKELIRLFGVMLYRMAYMCDHTKKANEECACDSRDITYLYGAMQENEGSKYMEPFYEYIPPQKAYEQFSKIIPQIADMSFEALLYYIELIAWNEDCKYFYRTIKKAQEKEKKPDWLRNTGRINTVLTFIAFLAFLIEDNQIMIGKFIDGFARGRGVSPISTEDLIKIFYIGNK